MHRLACVDLPAFSLQLLGRRHPECRERPAAVVTRDTPQGEIVSVNSHAIRNGIVPGQRYAAALALCPELLAGMISEEDIEQGVETVARLLDRFTPSVEPIRGAPGVFIVDASGMDRIHGSSSEWGASVARDVREIGLTCSVAVGFTRFGVYALARSRRGVTVTRSEAEEEAEARRTDLARMDLPPRTRDDLRKLGITTVGRLLSLPADDLLERFGPAVRGLVELARGTAWRPVDPLRFSDPPSRSAQLETPDSDSSRLLFLTKRLISPLLDEIASRGEALSSLLLKLELDHAPPREENVAPATPTLDQRQILDLVRLRLESIYLKAGVAELTLVAETSPATDRQLRLFREYAGRDPRAADRAFARIKARYGYDSVVRARLGDGHLPEARYTWEPLPPTPPSAPRFDPRTTDPTPDDRREGAALVRRIFERPVPMSTRPVRGPRGVHLEGLEHEPVVEVTGPFIVSGGWWHREIHREYHFARTSDGRILWIYFDRNRRRWYLHGTVE